MNVLFIQTGGSIDKDYPKVTKGYAFEITDPAVEKILSRVNPSFDFYIVRLLQKDSQEVTDEDRDLILKTCSDAREDKIVITHGTDTMIETAAKLSSLKDKTIVLTGSMRPEKFKDSDADFNVGVAVGALEYLPKGVYIAMHGRVLPYNKSVREMSSGKFVEK